MARLQRLGQLHGHLVALLAGEPGRDAKQGAARPFPHHHRLADTDDVGEMSGDLHGAPAAVGGVPGQQLHVDHLDHPRRGGFQVVQQDVRQLLRLQDLHRLLRRHALHPRVLIPQGGQREGDVLRPQPRQPVIEKRLLRQRLPRPQEELQRRRLHGGIGAAALGQREIRHLLKLRLCQQLQRQIAEGIRQGQRRALVLHSGGLIVGQQHGEEPLRLLGRAVLQRGGHHQLGGEPDVTGLLRRQLMVGIEQQVQVLRPQGELGLLHRCLGRGGGQLLLVAQAELGHHLAHQRRRLTADVALGMQQQLIEEVHRLDLLVGGQVGEVVLQNTQIGTDPGPVLLAAGLLQQVGEQPLVAQPAHHAQVVLHRHQAEGPVVLLRRHQRRVRLLLRRRVMSPQRHVHAAEAHIFLKVPQLAVHILIPALFGAVHVVQLAEDHVKGVLQGVQRRCLPAVRLPPLLGAEVGIDQQHGFHRQVGQLQIPCGVVARHLSHLGKAGAGQPLVGVVIVEIWHPLSRQAAEFADVVACRCRGGQPQIHRHAAAAQGAARRHGHMMHHGDVLQGAEGRQLAAQAQQLIDEVLPPHLQKPLIVRAVRRLRLGAEGEIHGHVEGQAPFLRQQQLQSQQSAQGKILLLLRGLPAVLGIQPGNGVVEHIAAPAALRRGNIPHGGGRRLDHGAAGKALPHRQKALGEALLRPALRHVRIVQPLPERPVPECVAPMLAENGFMGHICSSFPPVLAVEWCFL